MGMAFLECSRRMPRLRIVVFIAVLAGPTSAIYIYCKTDDDCINSSYGFDTCSNGGCTVVSPSPMPEIGVPRIMPTYLDDVIVGGDPCTWGPMKCASQLYWPGCEGSDFDDVCDCIPCRTRSLPFATD